VIDRHRNFSRNRNRTKTRIQNFEPKPEQKTDLNQNRNRKQYFFITQYYKNIFCINLLFNPPSFAIESYKCMGKNTASLVYLLYLKNIPKIQANRVKLSHFFFLLLVHIWTEIPAGTAILTLAGTEISGQNFGRNRYRISVDHY